MDRRVQLPTATTARGAATRIRIVEAAAAEIGEHGMELTTLDDVCRRSGTGKGQLFHHFPGGREQLLIAVAEFEAARVFDDQEPYLSRLTSRAAWEAWRDLVVTRYCDEGVHCPLIVLIASLGRTSRSAQAVAAALLRRWQDCVRRSVEATQAAGEADPRLDAERVAAAVIAGIQGGVTVLLATGSAEQLESGLAFILERLLLDDAGEGSAAPPR